MLKENHAEFIKELANIIKEFQLTQIEFKEGETHIKIEKKLEVVNQGSQNHMPTNNFSHHITPHISVPQEENYNNHPGAIKSPMVGTVYLSPKPDAPNFITIGSQVKSGDTVLLVEAMKTFNPVKATKDGTVKAILIEDGEAVEYDEVLVVIE